MYAHLFKESAELHTMFCWCDSAKEKRDRDDQPNR